MEEVDVNLEKVSINQALKLIQKNVLDKKLAFVLEDNKYYFLNDHTINKLMKGLVDENAIVQYKDQVKGPIQQTKDSDADKDIKPLKSPPGLEIVINDDN